MTMTITIPLEIYNAMINHALTGKPKEVCGILGGIKDMVKKLYPMTNTEDSPESYLMDPKEQFAVAKDLRANNLEMLAIYHSHPHTPARPSQKDIEMAFYPDVLYIIVSLTKEEPDVKAFSIKEKVVKEVKITVL